METVNKTDQEMANDWWESLSESTQHEFCKKYFSEPKAKIPDMGEEIILSIWYQETQEFGEPTNNNTDLKCTPEGFQELYMALEGIIKDWTKDNEIEEFRSGEIHGESYSYWAPASRMVSSEFIAKGREVLKKANPNYKP